MKIEINWDDLRQFHLKIGEQIFADSAIKINASFIFDRKSLD